MRGLRRDSRALPIVTGVVAAFVLGCGFRVVTAHRELKDAEKAFTDAKTAVAETRTDDAARSLNQASRHLHAARSAARAFPLGLTAPIPFFGSPSKAAVDVSRAGDELVAAGRVINDAAASFPTSGKVGVDGHDLSAFHDAAVASEDALVAARTHIERATAIVGGPAGALIPQVSGPARSALDTIGASGKQLDGAKKGLTLLADLTAPSANARILLLSQDTMELNATGGYIGSWGVLTFDQGTVSLADYHASEDLPDPQPPVAAPASLREMLPGPWRLSHANFWPDFPTSAKTAVDLFDRQGGGDVDGVFAITNELLEDIVASLGPISVPGYAPVEAKGLGDRILYEVELKRPLDTPRKKFLTELSDVVINRMFDASPTEIGRLAGRMRERSGSGRIQMWFADPHRQALIAGSSWSGALPRKADGDFLGLFEMSANASKANQHLHRDVSYRVNRDPATGDLIAFLDIAYRNDGEKSAVNPFYLGYLRVYAPLGSKPLDPKVHKDEGRAADGPYQVFSEKVLVYPMDTARLTFVYRLPRSVSARRYRLTWLRQAGTSADSLKAKVGDETAEFGPYQRVQTLTADIEPNPVARFVQTHRLLRWMPHP